MDKPDVTLFSVQKQKQKKSVQYGADFHIIDQPVLVFLFVPICAVDALPVAGTGNTHKVNRAYLFLYSIWTTHVADLGGF